MTDQEILAIVAEVVEKSKEAQDFLKKKKDSCIPEYYPTYKQAVENMESIRPHAEKGVFPEKLFRLRSPNQTDKEADYVKAVFKQTTIPVFVDYNSTRGRAWYDKNWNIKYGKGSEVYEKAEQTFQEYVEKGIKMYGSLENFMKDILPTQKAIDAMGVLAIKPLQVPIVPEGEGFKIDDTQLIEPQPVYYSCKQVVSYKDSEYFLIELKEKSLVDFGNKKVKEGRIFEFYDKNDIIHVRQIGKKIDNTFEVVPFFQHNWNKVPVQRLKGIPKIQDGEILYQSPFLYAVDNLDLALLNASNLQLSVNNCVYPYKVMVGDICEFEDTHGNKCIDGDIRDPEGRSYTCTKCSGTGLKSRMSPLGVLLLKPQTRTVDSELDVSQKPLEYISPNVDCLRFLLEIIIDHETRARKILHLKDSSGQVQFDKENNTATGSDNNLKALIAFVLSISHQEFALYDFALEAIGYMRYGEDYVPTTLSYPQTCDFKTEQDYLAEIDQANRFNLPPMVIHSIVLKYLQNVYAEKDQANILNLISATDRHLIFSNDDITLKIGKGLAEKWEEILHSSALFFVDELLKEDPALFEKDFEVQKAALIEKAKAKALELKSTEPNIVDDFLSNAGA